MKPKVVLYHPVAPDVLAKLNDRFDLTTFEQVNESNREDFLAEVEKADGLIGMGLQVATSDLRVGKKLRALATIAAGVDAFDVPELTAQGVVLMNLSSQVTESTADLGFALMMAASRRIVELDERIREGEWTGRTEKEWFGMDIYGKTLGIIGLGMIGTAIAKRAHMGFGMRILYSGRSPKPEGERLYGAERKGLDDLLQESDFVMVVVPLTDETKGMIGSRELALMKPTAVLVNIARGPIVDENALAEALHDRRIYAAGLDVYEKEPLPINSHLLGLTNVVLAPHIGSATVETRDEMARYAADSLIDYLCHGRARNVVNPEALAGFEVNR